MNEPRKDDERLSALLEGRVTGPERDALLAHLSASEDDYEVFVDTAEILEALEEEDARAAAGAAAPDAPRVPAGTVPDAPASAAPADVIPLRRPARGRWRSPWTQLAMAAGVAGVLLASSQEWRARSTWAADPMRLAERVAMPAGWADTLLWGTRSGTPVGSRNARAAQAGALLVDLAVAIRAHDAETTASLAATLRDYEPGAGEDAPLAQIQAGASAPPESLQPLLARATDQLGEVLGAEDHLRLGAWTEAARLAAAARQEEFFSARASRVMLRRAEGLTTGDAAAQAALRQVRELVDAEPRDWAAIAPALDALMRELAS